VANRAAKAVEANCCFRVTGRQPEVFDPMTATTRGLPDFCETDGRTVIPMRFEPGQSFFVVFRAPVTSEDHGGSNFHVPQVVDELSGPWEVSFDPKWGGPERIMFDTLEDWSKRKETGIKFYSGIAVYRKTFDMADASWITNQMTRVFLDLGAVKNLAHVELNGRDLGVVWCLPWWVECTGALQPGTNQVEIEVANLWPNRLIGDQSLPAEKRLTWTTWNPYKTDSPLLPSGLLGPVTLQIENEPGRAK
jgi:hypothetical protein